MPDLPLSLEHVPALGLFALLLLGGVGFPVPEDATLILCGVLISHNVVAPLHALPAVYVGVLIADAVLYWFGRKYGRAIATRGRFQKLISPSRLARVEDSFRRWGVFYILFGRHLAGLRAQLFLVAGTMKMPFASFLIADAVSASVTIALMVGAGYLGGNSLQVLRRDILRVEHIAVVMVIAALAVFLLSRYFNARKGDKREGRRE